MTQNEIAQVLKLLNSGEWWYEYGEHRVIKAEVRDGNLCIECERGTLTLKIVIEEGKRQVLFSGNPCHETCFLGNAAMAMKGGGPAGLNAQTFRHRSLWEAMAKVYASRILNARLGLSDREITALRLEGEMLVVVRGDEQLRIGLEPDVDDYGVGYFLPSGGELIPVTMEELLDLGREGLSIACNEGFQALSREFYKDGFKGKMSAKIGL